MLCGYKAKKQVTWKFYPHCLSFSVLSIAPRQCHFSKSFVCFVNLCLGLVSLSQISFHTCTCVHAILTLPTHLPAPSQTHTQTLIFSQFTSMLDILEDYLEMRGLVCSRLDGTMAFAEREKQMTMFRESPDCHIFLLSTRAGGLGINLTNADTVIIYDSDWVREERCVAVRSVIL